MNNQERSGEGPATSAPPDALGSLSSSAPLVSDMTRKEQRRLPAMKRRRRRRRLFIAAPFFVLLLVAVSSYTATMVQPTSMSWSERSVEWIRTEVPFGNGMVDGVEHVIYTVNAPKKGGPQLKRLPRVGLKPTRSAAPTTTPTTVAPVWPLPITPIFAKPLPGEGVWQPAGALVDGSPPVELTTFRPEVAYPQIVAYVAWFDHTRTEIGYYPGRYEPPNAAVRGPMSVPNDQRPRLLATFNGGFTYVDGNNGSTDNGLTNEPLKDGNATLVGYTNGGIAIVNWSGGPNAGPDVAWARQSLAPIVWNGQLNPALNADPNSAQWGYTLGGLTRVWRTGVGVDARGNLIYVVANDQTVITLGADPSACWRRGRDGVRHQPRVAHPHYLHPSQWGPRPDNGRTPAHAVG